MKIARRGVKRTRGGLAPPPDQPAAGWRREFEFFGHPQAVHPENFAVRRGGQNQIPPVRRRNFRVHKQILQLRGRLQANRLEPVAGSPVAQSDSVANFVRVKNLNASAPLQRKFFLEHRDLPAKFHAVKFRRARPARQF